MYMLMDYASSHDTHNQRYDGYQIPDIMCQPVLKLFRFQGHDNFPSLAIVDVAQLFHIIIGITTQHCILLIIMLI